MLKLAHFLNNSFFLSGFKVSNTSCCNVDTNIGGLCLPNSKLCSKRTDYVFWDAFHPSDKANEILAEKFFSTLFSGPPSTAPKPSPWLMNQQQMREYKELKPYKGKGAYASTLGFWWRDLLDIHVANRYFTKAFHCQTMNLKWSS